MVKRREFKRYKGKSGKAKSLDFLSVVEPYGGFITSSVLIKAFPQGLAPVEVSYREQIRGFISDVAAIEGSNPAQKTAWIEWVLRDLLNWDDLMVGSQQLSDRYHRTINIGTFAGAYSSTYGLIDAEDSTKARCLVKVIDQRTSDGGSRLRDPIEVELERFTAYLKLVDVPLGMLTNGNSWHVVWAPNEHASGGAHFKSELFSEEPSMLAGFVSLFSARQFFGVEDAKKIEKLFYDSEFGQADVADQLGKQAKSAISLLVASLSRINANSKGELLDGLTPNEIYNGLLTVIMRTIFVLFAEERGLLPVEEDLYREYYALSSLLDQLQEEADQFGEDPLSNRTSAYFRMLSLFRAIYDGVDNEYFRLPAYGGTLFDPNRFPFLEGRVATNNSFGDQLSSNPPEIDDLTILEVLKQLQLLAITENGSTDVRRLSFANLEVEQIGHVYESLIDPIVELSPNHQLILISKGGDGVPVELSELSSRAEGLNGENLEESELVKFINDKTKLTTKSIAKKLSEKSSEDLIRLLEVVVGYDSNLVDEIKPFLPLIEIDLHNLPRVISAGDLVLATSTLRSSGGVQYTPNQLANEIASNALEHLVYNPGPKNERDRSKWKLITSDEILKLKVCDPTVGSGAILVASGRYLATKLVEAWEIEGVSSEGSTPDEVFTSAFRKVAERCLYGVDRDPLAIEMAKISLWLSTMAKDRPLSFVDHALKSGDALLGVTSMSQIANMHLDPYIGKSVHGNFLNYTTSISPLLERSIELRIRLEEIDTLDIVDANLKAELSKLADEVVAELRVIGDLVVGAFLNQNQSIKTKLKAKVFLELSDAGKKVATALSYPEGSPLRKEAFAELANLAHEWLNFHKPVNSMDRRPFHWAIEFPEVFSNDTEFSNEGESSPVRELSSNHNGAFDAIVGNPPFLGGGKISSANGSDYLNFITEVLAQMKGGQGDLVAYFFIRACMISTSVGLIATNTIAQGDTSRVGLTQILSGAVGRTGVTPRDKWKITRAIPSARWPGVQAAVHIAKVWMILGGLAIEPILGDREVTEIDHMLNARTGTSWTKKALVQNSRKVSLGSKIYGNGFTMSPEEAANLIDKDKRNKEVLFPYLGGEDITRRPDLSAPRWVINLFDWDEVRARSYHDVFEIVERKVKPERQKLLERDYSTARRRGTYWWQYGGDSKGLYAKIANMNRVLAIARVSKFVTPVFAPTGQVFSEQCVVFIYDDDFHFGVLNSVFHYLWTVKYCSTFGEGLRYTPSDVFETFPQPPFSPQIEDAGKALDEYRTNLMLSQQIGLTNLYNRFHDPDDDSPEIAELRQLHIKIDEAVKASYGWTDLELGHGFFEIGAQGIRFTFAPETATEILERLLELNKAIYEEEQLLNPSNGKSAKKKSKTTNMESDDSLFG